MSMFAAKQSGLQGMIAGLLPPEIMKAITATAEKLPTFMQQAEQRIKAIEDSQQRIETLLQAIYSQLDNVRCDLDPAATPQSKLVGVLADGN